MVVVVVVTLWREKRGSLGWLESLVNEVRAEIRERQEFQDCLEILENQEIPAQGNQLSQSQASDLGELLSLSPKDQEFVF